MKSTALQLVAILALVLPTAHIVAQGTGFTYQGRLQSGTDAANGSYDLTFTLFGVSSGGSAIAGPVTNSIVDVTNGLFTVTLDFGDQFPGAGRWLEIGVRSNGEDSFTLLSPRQALTATPYAITASSLSGTLPATQLAGTVPDAQLSAGVSLLGASIDSAEIADDTITTNDLNASVLNGTFWKLGGNAGANPTNGNFLGTTDNQPLEFRVNGQRGFLLEAKSQAIITGAVNVVIGSDANFVSPGKVGATISGGGATRWADYPTTNSVTDHYGTIGGGFGNTAGYGGTVAGGWDNRATELYAFLGGGIHNVAGSFATVGGGVLNSAIGPDATVGGGGQNTASGNSATVPGGVDNIASGDSSFAAGSHARALHQHAFVWSDSQAPPFESTAADQFSVRALGGVRLAANARIEGDVQLEGGSAYHYLSLNGGNSTGFLFGSYPYFGDGVHLGYNFYADSSGGPHVINAGGATSRISAGYGEVVLAVGPAGFGPNTVRVEATLTGVTVHGTFNNLSDRKAKQDFTTVSPAQILEKVARLPLSEWSYKEDPMTRHVGPVAQDFYATFNIGTDDRHIAPIDEGGVALAAIQGLNEKVDSEHARLQEALKQKETEVTELKQRLEKLEQLLARKFNAGAQ